MDIYRAVLKAYQDLGCFRLSVAILIRNQILKNIPPVMKYRISVTRIKMEFNKLIGACVCSRTD